ncbi:hypothetical protein A1O1_00447 [Capronia coronata CBS 617.96]|uniref:Methyltransferase small domain-containing protein n=1 Tax=Capronia coronata CBS 617.96 TaxID=1182541 RepID=W9YR19_9EURO|nr:uncharacterized protein A1O1_00447 [Capronia coronata CBS 617.96]EXJ95327.1 hypothetical protein A1O1_00447 [Capronia coronata CBS 617.96]
MLPTPSTSHVSYDRIYEPAEDSYLFLDTLSSASETAWLHSRFSTASSNTQNQQTTVSTTSSTSTLLRKRTPSTKPTPPPLVVELGPGSGVIIAFLTAHAHTIFGREILSLSVDVNPHACRATRTTVETALNESKATRHQEVVSDTEQTTQREHHGPPPTPDDNTDHKQPSTSIYLASLTGDLTTPLRQGEVDVLIFNPPYVPTDSVPDIDVLRNTFPAPAPSPISIQRDRDGSGCMNGSNARRKLELSFEESSHLLALSYAGGVDGMQVTMRLLNELPSILSPRGVAYILFCRGNKPDEVKDWIRGWNNHGDGHDDNGKNGDGNRPAGSGARWSAETVGSSGKTAGWEKLEIVRICREPFADGPRD